MKKLLVLFLVFVLLSNIGWYFGGALLFEGVGKSYVFSSKDNSFLFEFIPSKGDDIGYINRKVEEWKRQGGCANGDCAIYRRFSRKWWQVWRWYEYLSVKWWYEIPYMGPNLTGEDLMKMKNSPLRALQ